MCMWPTKSTEIQTEMEKNDKKREEQYNVVENTEEWKLRERRE